MTSIQFDVLVEVIVFYGGQVLKFFFLKKI